MREGRIEPGSEGVTQKRVRRWQLEEKGMTAGFPSHSEEGFMFHVFMPRRICSLDGATCWPLTVRLGRVRQCLGVLCCTVEEESDAILQRAAASQL